MGLDDTGLIYGKEEGVQISIIETNRDNGYDDTGLNPRELESDPVG